jgi:hypothetical protein
MIGGTPEVCSKETVRDKMSNKIEPLALDSACKSIDAISYRDIQKDELKCMAAIAFFLLKDPGEIRALKVRDLFEPSGGIQQNYKTLDFQVDQLSVEYIGKYFSYIKVNKLSRMSLAFSTYQDQWKLNRHLKDGGVRLTELKKDGIKWYYDLLISLGKSVDEAIDFIKNIGGYRQIRYIRSVLSNNPLPSGKSIRASIADEAIQKLVRIQAEIASNIPSKPPHLLITELNNLKDKLIRKCDLKKVETLIEQLSFTLP